MAGDMELERVCPFNRFECHITAVMARGKPESVAVVVVDRVHAPAPQFDSRSRHRHGSHSCRLGDEPGRQGPRSPLKAPLEVATTEIGTEAFRLSKLGLTVT